MEVGWWGGSTQREEDYRAKVVVLKLRPSLPQYIFLYFFNLLKIENYKVTEIEFTEIK